MAFKNRIKVKHSSNWKRRQKRSRTTIKAVKIYDELSTPDDNTVNLEANNESYGISVARGEKSPSNKPIVTLATHRDAEQTCRTSYATPRLQSESKPCNSIGTQHVAISKISSTTCDAPVRCGTFEDEIRQTSRVMQDIISPRAVIIPGNNENPESSRVNVFRESHDLDLVIGSCDNDACTVLHTGVTFQAKTVNDRRATPTPLGIDPSRELHESEADVLVSSASMHVYGDCNSEKSNEVKKCDHRETNLDSLATNPTQESYDVEKVKIVCPADVYGGYEVDDTCDANTTSDKRFISSSAVTYAHFGEYFENHANRLQYHVANDDRLSLHCVMDSHCLGSQSDRQAISFESEKFQFREPHDLYDKDTITKETCDVDASVGLTRLLCETNNEECIIPNILEVNQHQDFASIVEDYLIEDEYPSNENQVELMASKGRRIINIPFFWRELTKKLRGHKCPFSALKIEKYFDRGMRTQLCINCQKCEFKDSIWTDPDDGPLMGINQSAVCGTITSGIGCSTLQELLASMGVPCMTQTTYRKYRDELYGVITQISDEEMARAAAFEAEIAIKKGHVIDGFPFITVVADGAWAKRSFAGGKHDSLSGVAIIFGHETGLALFVGVRNKYCSVHARAERLGLPPSEHVCYKNWRSDQSSTSMEKDIVVEGFNASLQCHGLIYKTLISDGDSSVYTAIRAANPYAAQGIIVRKIECNNHLFRNMCKKFRIASEKKFPRSVHPLLSIKVSKLRGQIVSSGLKIRKDVERARDIRKEQDISEIQKKESLQKDIFIVFNHVFGDHSECNTLAFACDAKEGDINLIPDLRRATIYNDVYKAVSDLSCHSSSLLENVTNNTAEACNSIINKCNAGKRTNQCARNSYEIRCHTGALQHNTQKVLSMIHAGAGKTVPFSVSDMERSRAMHVHTNKALRQDSEKPKRHKFAGTDKDYGPLAEKPDVPQDIYNVLVENHLKKLKGYQANRDVIERETVSQSDSDYWHALRTELITASSFGTICRMRPTTSCSRIVSNIRLGTMIDTDAVRYGIANEQTAREALQIKLGKKIVPCGLFIDKEFEYLGASPDGLIDDDGIVEIKCPYSAKDVALNDAFQIHPNLRNIFEKKRIDRMSKTHMYYYQVQGQLRITGRKYCIFAMWTTVDLLYVVVQRDYTFWRTKMEPALTRFYMNCLLPEIVDSRMSRGMHIRDPAFIEIARDEAKCRKEKNAEVKKRKQILNESNAAKRTKTIEQNNSTPDVIDAVPLLSNSGGIRALSRNELQPREWIEIDDDGIADLDEAFEAIEVVRQSISVKEVIADIQRLTNLLNDSSIDLFLTIVKENSDFKNFNPACYTGYASLIKSCNGVERDMQIVGGNKFRHWCCLYYNGSALLIYDSLCRCEYDFLHDEEKRYICKRYGHVDRNSIFLMPVTRQPDAYTCGVYSAAFVTSIALGVDPTYVQYSRDPVVMRAHLVSIIQSRKLTLFPNN